MPTSGGFFVSPGNSGSAGAPIPIKTPEVDDVAYPGGVYSIGLRRGIKKFAMPGGAGSSIYNRSIILDAGSNLELRASMGISGFRYGLRFSGIYFAGTLTVTILGRAGEVSTRKQYSFKEGCTAEDNDWTDAGGYLQTISTKASSFSMGWSLFPDHSVKGTCGESIEYDIKTDVSGRLVISEGVVDDAIVNHPDLLPEGMYIIKQSNISSGAPNSNPPAISTGRGSISF